MAKNNQHYNLGRCEQRGEVYSLKREQHVLRTRGLCHVQAWSGVLGRDPGKGRVVQVADGVILCSYAGLCKYFIKEEDISF